MVLHPIMTSAPAEVAKAPLGSKTDFRLDIGALRALAVTLVVLFHFGVVPFIGGFVGVDVFFVISGYLMTQIIVKGLARERFTLLGFYYSRVRRIVPALAVMCFVIVAVALIFVDPLSVEAMAKNAFYSLIFVSNIPYAFEQSYFASASESNWFLHTWTLSVEWQFYMLYPLVILGAYKLSFLRRRLFPSLVALTVVLFAATVLVCSINERYYQLGFFLLPTRAWELLAGGCVALAPAYRVSRTASMALHLAGLALILYAGCGFDKLLPWPSAWTALPVLGSVAVLAASSNTGLWVRAAPVQALGRWSYSAYLWHWPVVVGLHYFLPQVGAFALLSGIIATILLAAGSYALVEIRLRDFVFDQRRGPGQRWAASMIGLVSVAALCLAGWRGHGLETLRTRGFDSVTRATLADYRAATTDWKGVGGCGPNTRAFAEGHKCVIGDAGATQVAMIGDSHVEQLLPRYVKWFEQHGGGATFIYKDGCPAIPSLGRTIPGYHCSRFIEAALQDVTARHFRRVVLVSAWNIYFQQSGGGFVRDDVCFPTAAGVCKQSRDDESFATAAAMAFDSLKRAIVDLRAAGVEVIIVGIDPAPYDDTAGSLYKATSLAGAPVTVPSTSAAAFNERYAFTRRLLSETAKASGAELVEPVDKLCATGECSNYRNGVYLFKDGHHVRASVILQNQYAYLDQLVAEQPGALAKATP